MNYSLSWAQKAILEDFYLRMTEYGSREFDWPDSIEGYYIKVRFASAPEYSVVGGRYSVSLALDVLP